MMQLGTIDTDQPLQAGIMAALRSRIARRYRTAGKEPT